jgi:NAD(P)-dependent dehydrogenase (short-subunit alcohol dehydrogenase family)
MTDRAKVALVTGATSGVGRVVAIRLAKLGWRVLAHGRDASRGAEVVEAIEGAGGRAELYLADLAAFDGVCALAGAVAADHPELPLLINNAGIGFGGKDAARETSADGFELRFAVNYLAPVLLTRLLLPNLVAATPSRVINIASIGQLELDFEDLQFTNEYNGVDAYRRSKLAMIMWTFDLAEELRDADVTVNAVHPATFMDTPMVRNAGGTPMSTADEGADAIMQLAVGEEVRGRTGEFYNGLKPARAKDQAYLPAARERLRLESEEMIAEGRP